MSRRRFPASLEGVKADHHVVVVGAGFSGLGMGIKLREAGIESFVILERADEVGGTWRDNAYPGAGCDVASHLYSFSFEQNPDWTRAFGQQGEIQDYILHCARKYGLRAKIRFGQEVDRLDFDEEDGLWTVHTRQGETVTARVVVSAAGGLANPAWPSIEGLRDFEGKLFHTARWDHGYDLAGKRVGMVGTGASAIQAGPAIAPEVAKLDVFQRTPPWIIEKPDFAIPAWVRSAFRRSRPLLWLRRIYLYWVYEMFAPMIISDKPWRKRALTWLALRHMKKQLPDAGMRRRVTPDYHIGCKRILISNDWYPMLMRENVRLVTEPIERVTPRGVRTADGEEHELDALVCATGFEVSISNAPFDVRGLGGRTLDEAWAGGAEAYKGVAVAGFPNLFLLLGPNTGPGHTSVLLYTEKQIDYAIQAIQHLDQNGLDYLTVKQSVQDRFNAELERRLAGTVWSSGCKSWYIGENGKNSTLYPGFNFEYRLRTSRFRPAEYDVA